VTLADVDSSTWPARFSESLPFRCARRFISITGYDRALGLAAQAFIAAIPMVIVASSVGDGSSAPVAERLIEHFALAGSTADLVREALATPEGTTLTVWSAGLLVLSGVGFTRALQRAFRAAWGIRPAPGWRGWVVGMASALMLAAAVAAGAASTAALNGSDGGRPLGFALRAVVSGALWLLAIRLLLGWRLSWRPFLPGALVTGIGTALTWLVSEIWLPRAFASQAETYGLIGVFVVLISWLILLALLLVVAAVVSAELWHSSIGQQPDGTPPAPLPET